MRTMSFYSERAIAYLKEAYNEAASLDQELDVVDLDQFAEGVLEENMAKLHFMRVTPAQPAKHAPRCRSADRVGRVS